MLKVFMTSDICSLASHITLRWSDERRIEFNGHLPVRGERIEAP